MGGKPKPDHRIPTAKKRGRPSAGRTSSLNGGPAKKQRRSGDHSETDASARKSSDDGDDLNSLGPDDYTDLLGSDEWTPPIVSSESWERLVQKVETVEADDDGNLWVFLSWNLKDKDGRFLRNKVKATTCYKACPQLVCLHSVFIRSSRNSHSDPDAEILRKPSVSSISSLSLSPADEILFILASYPATRSYTLEYAFIQENILMYQYSKTGLD